jgi:3-oxoacyl-ACP reductase-like protein
MKSGWIVAVIVLIVASVACVQIVDEQANETVYKADVVQANKTNVALAKKVSKPVNVSVALNATEDGSNVSNAITGSAVDDEVFEDLTIGAAHKMTPELEAAVRNASCYNLTWNGLAEQQLKRPIEVRKAMRFNYMGGRLFKGWIVPSMYINNDMIDSQTVEVLVEFMQVTCLDNENFTIDWAEKLKKYDR